MSEPRKVEVYTLRARRAVRVNGAIVRVVHVRDGHVRIEVDKPEGMASGIVEETLDETPPPAVDFG